MNSVPDREMPLNFPGRFAAGVGGIEVAVSPDTRELPGAMHRRKKPVATVFRWEEPSAKQVFVSGSWDNFATRKQLVRSKSAHTIIMEIPPGQNRYLFYVDGTAMVDKQKPITANMQGEQHNMLNVDEVSDFSGVTSQTESSSPPGEYAQEVREPPPNPARKRKNANEPPMLPPHLLRALLNTQPQNNPLLLPLPHHVMLNHLYINRAREKDHVLIYGVTCRFRDKYVTTVLYKPDT